MRTRERIPLHDHADNNSGGRIGAQHVTGLPPAATGGGSSGGSGADVLDDLGDVTTAGVLDGDVLAYDSGTALWGPVTPATVTVYSPVSVTDDDVHFYLLVDGEGTPILVEI